MGRLPCTQFEARLCGQGRFGSVWAEHFAAATTASGPVLLPLLPPPHVLHLRLPFFALLSRYAAAATVTSAAAALTAATTAA